MIAALILTLAAHPVSVAIRVDGAGFLRFIRNGKPLYASEVTLTDRNGTLVTAEGGVLMPKVFVPARCTELTVTLDGIVKATTPTGTTDIGRVVLAMLPSSGKRSGLFSSSLHGELSDPGDGLAGVIRMHRERLEDPPSLHFQGPVTSTSSPLDLAINGRGFFQILQPNGSFAYTRDGSFQLDSLGGIVTRDGRPLFPQLSVPPGATSIAVAADGTVTYVRAGESSPTVLGQIPLVCFANPDGLRRIGRDRFVCGASSGFPTVSTPGQCGAGELLSGYLEDLHATSVTEYEVRRDGGEPR